MKVSNSVRIRVLTHNIRYATNAPFEGEEKWEVRRSRLINELRFNTRHCAESFICLQEVLHRQLLDIMSTLNDERRTWDYVGVGRDDGYEAGEYSPIIFEPRIWELKMQKTKWLSKTPDEPSRSWDASCNRILTIAVFEHRSTRKIIVAMNTHLDDQGSKSRLKSAELILEEINSCSKRFPGQGGTPVFLAGDFNSEPGQEAYKEMTKVSSPMVDLQLLIPEERRYGNSNTFTGFTSDVSVRKRIDFIFINGRMPNSEPVTVAEGKTSEHLWQVEGYAVLPNLFEDGIYNSDHQAVIGDMILR